MLSVGVEVTEVVDLVRSRRIVFQGLRHLREVGLLGLGADFIVLLDGLAQFLGEQVESFDVGLDYVQLLETVFLGKRRMSATLVHFFATRHLAPDKVHLLTVLLVLEGNFLPETLDRHKDDAVLASGLQHLLRLLLVANHEQGLLSLDALQLSLLISDLVREVECLLSRLFLEAIHLGDEIVHFSAALLVVLVEYVVGLGQAHVPRVDLRQVRELVVVGLLHLLEEVFELL